MRQVSEFLKVVVAVLRRPDLWLAAGGVLLRMVPNNWLTMGPMPTRSYLDYRGQAVYGTSLLRIPAHDVVRYLEWCKAFPGPID